MNFATGVLTASQPDATTSARTQTTTLAPRRRLLLGVLLAHGAAVLAVATQPTPTTPPEPVPVLEVNWLPAPSIATAPPAPAVHHPTPRPHPVTKPATPHTPATTATPPLLAAASSKATQEAPVTPATSPPAQASPPGGASNASNPPATPTPPRFDADYLSNPAPNYPRIARELGEEGRVHLRVHVTAQGRPSDIQLQRSSGSSRLDQAAEQAVWRWKFIPARLGQEAQPGWVIVPINFSLRR